MLVASCRNKYYGTNFISAVPNFTPNCTWSLNYSVLVLIVLCTAFLEFFTLQIGMVMFDVLIRINFEDENGLLNK
jgi:hypothetical protein